MSDDKVQNEATKLEALHKMAQSATKHLMSFEDTTKAKKDKNVRDPNKPAPFSLSQIFAALYREPPDSTKEEVKILRASSEFEDIQTHMQSYTLSLKELFPGHLGTIVVFFMPGTQDPIPLYLGDSLVPGEKAIWDKRWVNWNGKERENGGDSARKDMQDKIKEIAIALRHHVDQESGKDVEHFFFVARNVAKAMAGVLRKDKKTMFESPEPGFNQDAGRYDSTIYAIPTSAKIEFGNQGVSLTTWREYDDSREDMAAVISSPVFVNHDSFALMASFFNREDFRKVVENKITSDLKEMLLIHGLFARNVFGAFYEALLRDSIDALPKLLERTHISHSLLRESAKHLRVENGSFTYEWKKDEKTDLLCCADLEADLFGDVIHDADTVFDHVLKTEKGIYEKLYAEWDDHNLGENPLPSEMPLAEDLRGLEYAQRALGATSRDHIVHQFQVFLMGSLIIRKDEKRFRELFPANIVKRDATDENGETEEEKKEEEGRQKYLLRLAWFLCATMHDVGYPIGLIDDVAENMRQSACKLLPLGEHFVDKPSSFRIDALLYDDPRTYIILRELTRMISIESSESESSEIDEALWYFIRHLAFNRKHHAVASVVALCMRLIDGDSPTGTDTIGSAKNFFQEKNPFGHFIAKHVLMPVLLHHAYTWIDEKGKILDDYITKDKDNCVKKTMVYKKSLISDALSSASNFFDPREGAKPGIKFSKFPLAILLAFCDILQETGRPAGARKDEWPSSESDHLEYLDGDGGHFKFTLNLKYTGDDRSKCEDDCKKRYENLERLSKVFEMSRLPLFEVTVHSKYKRAKNEMYGSKAWTKKFGSGVQTTDRHTNASSSI